MPGPLSTTTTITGLGYFVDGKNNTVFPNNAFGMKVNSPGVTPPPPFTSGSATWLQVIAEDYYITIDGTHENQDRVVNYLDNTFPYGALDLPPDYLYSPGEAFFTTNDSPFVIVNYPPDTEADRDFAGSMYYMWRSDAAGSIWVPLARAVFNWGFEGEIDWSSYFQQFIWGNAYCNPSPFKLPTSVTTPSGEPNWVGTYHNQ
jgi:hypothetical protein